jgi:hypothetical protein
VKATARYTELRRINDGAYFLIIFATFEKMITGLADKAVQSRRAKPKYSQRRAWETINAPAFRNRIKLVLDQNSGHYAKLISYYDVRNDLAHEGATLKTFSIPTVVADLKSARRSAKA